MRQSDEIFADTVVAFFLAVSGSKTLLGDTLEQLLNPFDSPNPAPIAEAWNYIRKKYAAIENPLGMLSFSPQALESAKKFVEFYRHECTNQAEIQFYESLAQKAL